MSGRCVPSSNLVENSTKSHTYILNMGIIKARKSSIEGKHFKESGIRLRDMTEIFPKGRLPSHEIFNTVKGPR